MPVLTALLAIVVGVLIWSAVDPRDAGTWALESVWVPGGLVVVLALWRRFPLPVFLGGQGDPWGTQWDVLMALIGASLSLVLLSRAHDRALRVLEAQ